VWLDFGELKQIADAPGADRGLRTPAPRERSETMMPAARSSIGYAPDRDGLDDLLDLFS
jgi:hypothetical protein